MIDLVVPDFVSNPQPSAGFASDEVAERWLVHLSINPPSLALVDKPGPIRAERIRLLATALTTSEERVAAILNEVEFKARLKFDLLEFDSIPHEIDARQQFIDLATKTYHSNLRHGLRGAFGISLRGTGGGGQASARDPLVEQWREWYATWEEVTARNPPLELRKRMGEVFDTNDFTGWRIGGERLLYDWLERGTRDPMPFTDLRRIITEGYYRRLCELRDKAGGWWYWNKDVDAIVFVSRGEWEAISSTWPRVLDQVCQSLGKEEL